MRASSLSLTRERVETTKSFTLGTTETFVYSFPGHGSSSFTFGGFGSKDPRRRKAPNAGTYSVARSMGYLGSETYLATTSEGKPLYQTDSVGARSGARLSDIQSFSAEDATTIYNNALTKLNSQIRDSDLNLAVSLAESGQTLRMLGALSGVVALARDARNAVKTGRISRRIKDLVNNPSREISSLWLQMKYGWLPLYSDIYGVLQYSTKTFKDQKFIGRSKRTYPLPPPVVNTSLGTVSTIEGRRSYQVEVGGTVSVADQTAFDVSRISSLNPAAIAWELVPFSFVVDWVWDVGGYLQNVESALSSGLTWKHGYRTDVAVSIGRETLRIDKSTSTARNWGRYSAEGYYVTKTRTVLPSWPMPNIPRFNARLGAQRVMSAASLLRTLLLK